MHRTLVVASLVALMTAPALAAGEVNLYSSRHYDTDEALYKNFEEKTGITVNRIEDSADKLIARIKSEGDLSPADVLLTVDVGRIHNADEEGILQPIGSDVVAEKVPANLRDESDHWAGVTTRARIIFYDKDKVSEPPQTYEELADPKYEGMICTRSSSNVYMLGLLASVIETHGEDVAKDWATGLKNNLARDPEGGDTDQLRAVISGDCAMAVSNHYYFARGFRKDVSGLSDGLDKLGYVFPNQDDRGTHVNISGAAIAKNAPNVENARAFIEYLLTPEAQKMIADGNDEFPVISGVAASDAVVNMGDFKRDDQSIAAFAPTTARAQEIYNEIGYK